MPPADVDSELDLDSLVDFSRVLKCDGINYLEDEGTDWQEPCDNPAEWTRTAHCAISDFNFCAECKNLLSDWARHGWVKCRECRTTIFPEELRWRRL